MTLPPEFLARPIAHRGLHDAAAGRPENSLAAARAAVAAGYGIEVDLQISADGVAMVFHDERLERMTDARGWVADRSARELAALCLGRSDETVPTLAELLETVAGRVPLLIELKDQTAHPGGTLGPLEDATAAVLDGYAGPVAVMSFHPVMVGNLARACPGVPRGITGHRHDPVELGAEAAAALNAYAAFDGAGASFVSHDWHDLAMPSVAALKARGVPVLCWTVTSPEEDAAARRIADNVTFEGYLPA